ncbi:hypothetical protein BWD07_10045, partial [Neisseria canis]
MNIKEEDEFRTINLLYDNYQKDIEALDELLISSPHLASFKSSYIDLFRKTFLLACANAFERHLCKQLIKVFCPEQELLSCFLKKQALNRKYHTLFQWESSNANAFFALFGDNFKNNFSAKLRDNSQYKEGEGHFLFLGNKRNEIVHQGFDFVPFTEDVSDIWEKYKKALDFYVYLWKELE